MTTLEAQRIIQAALDAASAAAKQGNAYSGKVPWSKLYRLRQALLDAGLGTAEGWTFPADHYGLEDGWRLADWNETAQYGEADAFGNRQYSHARCSSCRSQAVYVHSDGSFACDRHVPTVRPRP